MPIRFRCSHCNKRVQAPDTASGKRAKCPACREIVEVPVDGAIDGLLAALDELVLTQQMSPADAPSQPARSPEWKLGDAIILPALAIARKNCSDWRKVFEHSGPVMSNPIFAEPGTRFSAFLFTYRVHRTVKAGTHDEFRRTLRRNLASVVQDDSGIGVDNLEAELRPSFGTHDPPRSVLSALSKVCAFVRPERFVAWDQYARKGLNVALGRSKNSQFPDYAAYLHAFDSAWQGCPGQDIRDYVARHRVRTAIEMEPRFLRRVLDVCLMKLGDRKMAAPTVFR